MGKVPMFRAWDKKNEVMCYVWKIAWKTWDREDEINYVEVESMEKPDGTYELFEHEVDLLQRTGLNDKNGKEIYDLDLLKPERGGDVPELVVWDEFRWTIAYWHVGTHKHIIDRNVFLEHFEHSEIVGSIHEDPELLRDPYMQAIVEKALKKEFSEKLIKPKGWDE